MALKLKEQVNELLQRTNYKEISELELADYIGFNNKEKTLLKLFWGPAFNESWIYLSDYIILECFSDEVGKDSIKHFYERMLIPNCEEGEDYKKISKDDPLVTSFDEKSYSPNLANRKDIISSNRKKYYAITGECLKKLLLLARSKKGKETRMYYLKVEKLAQVMFAYINTLEKYIIQKQIEEKDKTINEKEQLLIKANSEKEEKDQLLIKANSEKEEIEKLAKESIAKKELVIKGMKSLVENTEIATKSEYFYIAVSNNDAKENKFTIGKTIDLKARLSQYNCKKSGDSLYRYAYYRKCYDAHQLENTIRRWLIKYKVNNTKDLFQVRYDYLERMVEAALISEDCMASIYNEFVNASTKEEYYTTNVHIPSANIDTNQQPNSLTTEFIDQMEQEELKKIIKNAISKYIQKYYKIEDFDYDKHKDMDYNVDEKSPHGYMITIKWDKYKDFLTSDLNLKLKKITPVKSLLKDVIKTSETVKCSWK